MATEKFVNLAQSTLNTTINNSTTSVIVNDASSFPSSAQFRIAIDREIMLVTGIASNTFTVTRGAESSTATSHTSGAQVSHILTSGAMNQIIADDCQQGTFASLPAVEKAGRLYFATNGYWVSRDTGSVWSAYGPLFPLTTPVSGNFSWQSQGSATLSTTNGGMFIRMAGGQGADNIHAQVMTLSGNYTKQMGFIPMIPAGPLSYPNCGMCLTDGTKFVTFSTQWRQDGPGADNVRGNFISITYWTNNTTFSSDAINKPTSLSYPIFFQISDNGTTRSFATSNDGVNFTTWFSDTHTTHLTATKIGFYVNPVQCASDVGMNVISWID